MPTTTKPIFLQANWSAPANIRTLLTTASAGFNLATHVGAPPKEVAANRAYLQQWLPASPLWLNQVHGDRVLLAEEQLALTTPPDADACISYQARQVLAVMTADCLPLLVTNQQGQFVAVIHAGWRGLQAGIINKTIIQLKVANPSEILVFIGPAICSQCFEVGTEVRNQFIASNPQAELWFSAGATPNKYHANLAAIAKQQLVSLGIPQANISHNGQCTKCNPQWFYSYRGNPQCGRLAFLIWRDDLP